MVDNARCGHRMVDKVKWETREIVRVDASLGAHCLLGIVIIVALD